VAEEFEGMKGERLSAIEDLVRLAKCLPVKACEIQTRQTAADAEKGVTIAQFNTAKDELDRITRQLGQDIAVLRGKIEKGEDTQREYSARQIEKKAGELETLPGLKEKKRVAEDQYATLTAKYDDENQRKVQMLASGQQAWAELSRRFEQRKAEAERVLGQAVQQLAIEHSNVITAFEEEQRRVKSSCVSRRAGLTFARTSLNDEFKALAETSEPQELKKARKDFEAARQKQRDEESRLQGLRADIILQKEKRDRAREKIELDAETERSGWQTKVDQAKVLRDRTADELAKFDESLARFFQIQSPEAWPNVEKALDRSILFKSAKELEAKVVNGGTSSAWGVEFSAEKLPPPVVNCDRSSLDAKLQDQHQILVHAQGQLVAAQERYVASVAEFEQKAMQAHSELQSKTDSTTELCRTLSTQSSQLNGRIITLQSQFEAHKKDWRLRLQGRDTELKELERLLDKDERQSEDQFQSRKLRMDADFSAGKAQFTKERDNSLATIAQEESQAIQQRDADQKRIEEAFQQILMHRGVNTELIREAKARAEAANMNITRIEGYTKEVVEYQRMRHEFVIPLDSLRSRLRSANESLESETGRLNRLIESHQKAVAVLKHRLDELAEERKQLDLDEGAVSRFRKDLRFQQELGFFDREDLGPAPFYRAGAAREFLQAAEAGHEKRGEVDVRGNRNARAFLNCFDPETLDRKVLGFSPIHEHFSWHLFIGAELRPFVNGRGIQGMKQIQTQEFEQLIRNICAKNADFREGIRQVKQTATLVQANLETNNFVDVLDSIELKVERIDNNLTHILSELESFAGMTFGANRDLFGKRADRDQIDKAIETFARLVREIENCTEKRLHLTDYFDFLIRVHENGHDMGWRKSLDHIGSTGTDYLVKMLIYLSLIEVYRERAIDSKAGSTVHCVLDETGVLAPKYIRSVLDYAKSRGIILITAGHSQQTVGFENWVRVRKRGQRFVGQTILRKVLKCD
jgi:hypothetical protein